MSFYTGVNEPIPGSRNPVGYVNGLTADWLSNTTLTLNTGSCSDSLNEIDMTVATAITINGAINGATGLDTGSLAASTFYYVYVVGDSSSNNLPTAVISTSLTGPLMPYGYDCWRLVDAKVTDGSSHFRLSYTNGQYSAREFIYDTPLTVGSLTTGTGYAAAPLTGIVAPIGSPDVCFSAVFTPSAGGHIAYLRPTGATGDYAKLSGVVTSVAQYADIECTAFVATSIPSIDFKTTAATPEALSLYVKSFTYNV